MSIRSFLYFLISVILVFCIILMTFENGNSDDKAVYFAYSSYTIFSPTSNINRLALADTINRSITDPNQSRSKWRALERLSTPYTYLLSTKAIYMLRKIMPVTQLSYCEQISIATSLGMIIPHIFILLIFLCLYIFQKTMRPFLFISMLTLIMFTIFQKFLIALPEFYHNFVFIGYSPIIYVSRGALGLLVILQGLLFISNKRHCLVASLFIAPFIHLGHSIFTNFVFVSACIISMLYEENCRFSKFIKCFGLMLFVLIPYALTTSTFLGPTLTLSLSNIEGWIALSLLLGVTGICIYLFRSHTKLWAQPKYILSSVILLLLAGLLTIDAFSNSIDSSSSSQLFIRIFGNVALLLFILLLPQHWLISPRATLKSLLNRKAFILTFSISITGLLILNIDKTKSFLHEEFIVEKNFIKHEFCNYGQSKNQLEKTLLSYSSQPINLSDEVLFHLYLENYFSNKSIIPKNLN